MVISALTISLPASLPGEAEEFKTKAKAMPVAPWGRCAGGSEPPLPGAASGRGAEHGERGQKGRGALAPATLCSVLGKHLWK